MKLKISIPLIIFTLFSAALTINANTKNYFGFNPDQMDVSVKPSTNFYKYAVGNWIKNNPVPADKGRWGTFNQLRDKSLSDLKKIIKTNENKKFKDGTIEQKIVDFYLTGMDIKKVDEQGIKPIKYILSKINNIQDKDEFIKTIAYLQLYTSSPFFNFGVAPDLKNTDVEVLYLGQGGLGLPDKSYYLDQSEHYKNIREKYVAYIADIFNYSGENLEKSKADATTVLKIETELAKGSKAPVELREILDNYHPMSLEKVDNLSPAFDWKKFFSDINIKETGEINVGQPDFLKTFSSVIELNSMKDLKCYLKWNLLNSLSPYLGNKYEDANFNFYGKTLSGTLKIEPRWKRVISTESSLMGEALGQLYVKKYFPPESKEKALKIVDNLISTLGQRINKLTWMSDNTKKNAIKKLKLINVKIGYPDKWIDYSKLIIKNDSYVKNVIRAGHFMTMRNLNKLGKPTDRSEWGMSPQTVNAYYSPTNNEIVFPAAILQPPFFNPKADDAINYGAMGSVIGHELTHGFDDQGRLFNGKGNLKEWWTKEDSKKFKAISQNLVNQFNNYEPIKGKHVNGQLTLGENIADLGGITISYNAFTKTKEYKANKKIDGFTPEQRFFLGYAQVWRSNIRNNYQLMLLKGDPHSPAQFRVNGPLSDFGPFIKAFKIKPGTHMYNAPEDRIVIW
ncbi:MAG TPA: M13 family metallopeptidase [Victivallales bacterium]|nr:M13 family metallopeptidase [Victivallales bacterium]